MVLIQAEALKTAEKEAAPKEAAPKEEAPEEAAPEKEAPEKEAPEEEAPEEEAPEKEAPKKEAKKKSPYIAVRPKVRVFRFSEGDVEPIYSHEKKFQSPVFLVDPMFTDEKKDDEIEVFRDNDLAGFRMPLVHSKFPFLRREVQHFFNVGDDCSRHSYMEPDTYFVVPEYSLLKVHNSY